MPRITQNITNLTIIQYVGIRYHRIASREYYRSLKCQCFSAGKVSANEFKRMFSLPHSRRRAMSKHLRKLVAINQALGQQRPSV